MSIIAIDDVFTEAHANRRVMQSGTTVRSDCFEKNGLCVPHVVRAWRGLANAQQFTGHPVGITSEVAVRSEKTFGAFACKWLTW